MPVFNTVRYLPQCLDSILNQTLSDIEIICVDNGSTDGSYEMLTEYAAGHPQIYVLRHTEGVQGNCRNIGLEIAKGEYVGFVDSDDYIESQMFEKLYSRAKEFTADVAVCDRYLYFEKDEKMVRNNTMREILHLDRAFSISDNKKLYRTLTPWDKIFLRTFIDNNCIRYPIDQFHEDLVFSAESLMRADRIVAVDEPLYYYRKQRFGGNVSQDSGRSVFDVFKSMEKLARRAKGLKRVSHQDMAEIKIQRYVTMFPQVAYANKREFFDRMKIEFQQLDAFDSLAIVRLKEFSTYRFILGHSYVAVLLRERAKTGLAKALKIESIRAIYSWLKRRLLRTISSFPVKGSVDQADL